MLFGFPKSFFICYIDWADFFRLQYWSRLTGAVTFYFLFRRMEGNKFVNAFVIILATVTAAPIWSHDEIFSFLILALLDGWLLNQI